jgi:hypothetical protein
MFTRIAIPVVVGASLLAGAAMAAGPMGGKHSNSGRLQYAAVSMAEKCTSLEHQTVTAIKDHALAKKITEAKKMHEEGSKLCAGDKKVEGITKLEQALRDLGVKPQY